MHFCFKYTALILCSYMPFAFAQNSIPNGKFDARVPDPFVFCSAPKPFTQPFNSIYDNICSSDDNKDAIYGHCGIQLNSCATGNFVDVADNSYMHIWVCQGYNEKGLPHGNYSESCSIRNNTPFPDLPSPKNTITPPPIISSPEPVDTTSNQSPIYGHCGIKLNSCVTGNFVDVADNSYIHIWVCQGYNEKGLPHGNYSESCSIKIEDSTNYNSIFK